MSMPALIDDDNQSWAKLYETYSPLDNTKREYTALYAIGLNGKVVFKSAWISPGKWSAYSPDPYPKLDEALAQLLATGAKEYTIVPVKNRPSPFFITNSSAHLELPRHMKYFLGIYNLEGKCIVTIAGTGSAVFNTDDKLSSGKYMIRINAGENNFTKGFIVNK